MLRKLMLSTAAFAAVVAACAPAFAGVRQKSFVSNLDTSRYVLVGKSHPGDSVMLNPQPLPPGGRVSTSSYMSRPGGWVMLNPQPLPPRVYR